MLYIYFNYSSLHRLRQAILVSYMVNGGLVAVVVVVSVTSVVAYCRTLSKEEIMPSTGDKFIFFLMGGFIGASIALLFSPKTGEEAREFLGQKYREGTDNLARKAEEGSELIAEKSKQAAEKMSATIDRGKGSLVKQKEQLTAAIEAGKEAYEEEKRKLETEEPA